MYYERKFFKSHEEAKQFATVLFTENKYIAEINIAKKKMGGDWEVSWHTYSTPFVEKFIKQGLTNSTLYDIIKIQRERGNGYEKISSPYQCKWL